MSVQARMNQSDPRLYSPNRDVAHNFRFVVTEVARRLEEGTWPELDALLVTALNPTSLQCNQVQLGQAAKAVITFVATAVQDPKEDMYAALIRSGWFAVPLAAQVAYMACLGQVMAGVYFHGARESTLGGEGPCSSVGDLVAAGRRVSQMMSIPRWRRPWARLGLRLKEALRAFRNNQGSAS